MKIVLITSGTVKGSLSYRAVAFAKELSKNGHEVYLLAPRFDKYSHFKDEKITQLESITVLRPLQFKRLPFTVGLVPYIISSLFLLVKVNPDIVHIFKTNPITIPGIVLKLNMKTKIVVDLDDLDSEVMKIEKNSPFRIMLVQLSAKLAVTAADMIITASKYLHKKYSVKLKNKSVRYVPNGAQFDTVYKNIAGIKQENRIVFVGALNRKNILEPLFYAVSEIQKKQKSVKTIVIGDGMYLSYFKNLAKDLHLEKVISFTGWIEQSDLHKYIKPGDLGYCYMPNEETIKACSSMKVFQYMQHGVVPLVSNVGDLPDYVFSNNAGYIAKHSNLKSLIKTIEEALANKSDRKNKIKFTRAHAAEKYKWSVLAQKVEAAYVQII